MLNINKKIILFLVLILACESMRAAAPGTTCSTAIPMGENFSETITGAKTVWYSAWTFDLPLTVKFIPNNPSDPAPDVEMDFTCTPGVYADDILCGLFCPTAGEGGIDIDMPHHPALSSDTEDGVFFYYLAMGKSYRDLLLKTGIDYNVEVFVKVTYKAGGKISLVPDDTFSNCMDGHKFMHLGDTVQVKPLDNDRHVIVPYVQWQEDSIRYVWNGTEDVIAAVGYKCDYDPESADEVILDKPTLHAPHDTLKMTSAELKHYVQEAESEAGMFYAKFYSVGTGTMKIERVPQAPPQGGATLLKYDRTTTIPSDTNRLYAIPHTWDTATLFTTPTDHIFKMYVSTTPSFYLKDAMATYQFSANQNGHWLGLTSEQMQALWAQTNEKYLYVRFECTANTTVTPTIWDVPECFTKNTAGGEIKHPGATLSLEKGTYGLKYYRFYFREWKGGDMSFHWTTSNTAKCPTFIGKTCTFTANANHNDVLASKNISKNGTWTIEAADVAEWEEEVGEDGYLYICFNAGNAGTMTITTTAPAEEDSPCNPYDSVLTVMAWDSCIWRGTRYTAGGEYTVNGPENPETHCVDTVYTLRLTIHTTSARSYDLTGCDSIVYIDKTYTQSGEYVDTVYNVIGNRTITTLNITVNHSTSSDTTATACDSIQWRGEWYKTSGDYSDTLINAAGCDSIRTLHLTITHVTTGDTIADACGTFEWHGALYEASGDYFDTITKADGCDSIVTLHLTIHQATQVSLPDTTVCDSYYWGDVLITESGTYTRSLQTVAGCDSIVKRTFKVGQTQYMPAEEVTAYDRYTWVDGKTYTASTSGPICYLETVDGCDSIVSLALTIRHLVEDTLRVSVCASELPYVWYGVHFTNAGFYSTDTITGVGVDVDTVHNLALDVLPTYAVDTTVALCGTDYTWRGQTYTESGVYPYSTQTLAGCDSTVTLHLTLSAHTGSEETSSAYDAYAWNGETYTESGTYTYTATNAAGCDSTVTLHLTIRHLYEDTLRVSVCDSELPYVWQGMELNQGGLVAIDTIPGMGTTTDSVHALDLTVLPTYAVDTTVEACVAFEWYGQTYTESGTYQHVAQTAALCDSIVTLHLTLHTPTGSEETVSVYDAYVWNNETYTESGTYTYATTNAAGCDSTVTLHLTIRTVAKDTTRLSFCDDELPYDWQGMQLTQGGVYTTDTLLSTSSDTDTLHTLVLTVNPIYAIDTTATVYTTDYTWRGETYTESGDYTFATKTLAGCDSVVTLHLTFKQKIEQCDTVYFCRGYNTEHDEVVGDVVRRYVQYVYVSPTLCEDCMEGVVVESEPERALVDLAHVEANFYAYYEEGMTPIQAIQWSTLPYGETKYMPLDATATPQWIANGVLAIQIQFVCGERYSTGLLIGSQDMNTTAAPVVAEKILENEQVVILRGGKKYTITGLQIK